MRKLEILNAGVDVARESHILDLTLTNVAQRAGCAHSLVTYYFKTIGSLRGSVYNHAIETECIEVLAQCMAVPSLCSRKLKGELKTRVLEYVAR